MMAMTRWLRSVPVVLVAIGALLVTLALGAQPASAAASPPQLDLKVLLIGPNAPGSTTAAWQSTLNSEGVPYTYVSATGSYGSQTVSLPPLSSGNTGFYNGVVIADSPSAYDPATLAPLAGYETTFAVRQIDGYMYPDANSGLGAVSAGALDGITAQLTPAGQAALPELKGPIPFSTGTYGYPSTSYTDQITPWLTDSAGHLLAGVYQHTTNDPENKPGVSELEMTFDYGPAFTQWLLLAPGLINWLTRDTHLGLHRNYLGQVVDDVFSHDPSWSSQYQCTPEQTSPVDPNCPASVQGNAADGPPPAQMTAADVTYVTNWEQQTGVKLEFGFNGAGACTAPSTTAESQANCGGSTTVDGATYTDPGQVVDQSAPDDSALVNTLLTNQASFNWVNDTWSSPFLGCQIWQGPSVNAPTAGSGGTLAAGDYNYLLTAATAFGESEPSAAVPVTVAANGSVSLSWPDATNGGGPSLSTLEHSYGSGFWGYDVYRQNPGASGYGLVGQVAEDPTGGTGTYTFTDSGTTTPGRAPSTDPTATNPGIECAGANGADWAPGTTIESQIGSNDAFAASNGLTNYTTGAVVTSDNSGLENPNMPAALAATGITTFGTDASRQPNQYSIGQQQSAPRYSSNIYRNASNWPDELNEYNTNYVAAGTSLNDAQYPNETGRCAGSASTTCRTTPAAEADVLASESSIMLGRILADDPRMNDAHQSNLVGPATQTVNGTTEDYGYPLLTLLNTVLAQYNSWSTAPLTQLTDTTSAQALARQSAWSGVLSAGSVSGSVQNGVVTITNSSGSPVDVPVTVPPGTTVNGSGFGESYGGALSGWSTVNGGQSLTLTENVAPTFLSIASTSSLVGTESSFTVAVDGAPYPAITETGGLPSGMTLTDNGNGTATIAGTPAPNTGNTYPITITASSPAGTAAQSFTLTNTQQTMITSPSTANFTVGIAGTYTVTTTGYPTAAIGEIGALPAGLSFKDNGDGTATISGTPAVGSAGSYQLQISAGNQSGAPGAMQYATILVYAPNAPAITSGSTAYFTVNTNGAFAITATGSPTPSVSVTGAVPAGLTLTDEGNGTVLLSGTPTTPGSVNLTVTATNALGNAGQTLGVIVGQAPAFLSGSSASFTVGQMNTFQIFTSGYPPPSIGESGTLPAGLVFTSYGNNDMATISGTPAAGTAGTYSITLTAVNGTGTANQTVTITVS